MKYPLLFCFAILLLAGWACNAPNANQPKPIQSSIQIVDPATGQQIPLGQSILVKTISIDPQGIQRVELTANGVLVANNPAQNTPGQLTLVQSFSPREAGSYVLIATAYDAQGEHATSAPLTIEILPQGATPGSGQFTATPTLAGGVIGQASATPLVLTATVGFTPPTHTPTLGTITPTETKFLTPTKSTPSDTPPPASPTFASAFGGEMNLLYIEVTSVARIPNSNDGNAMLRMVFTGGRGPYSVYFERREFETERPANSFVLNGQQFAYVTFGPVRGLCGAPIVANFGLDSADGKHADKDFYIARLDCP
ncbi:MAG TPA: hypothetical protein PK299_01870 [Anaerolineales bacterium]|nr:hypothetical protein [Anaerolineales bacterium]